MVNTTTLLGLSSAETREQLGISEYQMQKVIDSALVAQHTDGSFSKVAVRKILDDRAGFITTLNNLSEVNLNQAACRLNISKSDLLKILEKSDIEPARKVQGLYGEFVFYKTSDIDSLLGFKSGAKEQPPQLVVSKPIPSSMAINSRIAVELEEFLQYSTFDLKKAVPLLLALANYTQNSVPTDLPAYAVEYARSSPEFSKAKSFLKKVKLPRAALLPYYKQAVDNFTKLTTNLISTASLALGLGISEMHIHKKVKNTLGYAQKEDVLHFINEELAWISQAQLAQDVKRRRQLKEQAIRERALAQQKASRERKALLKAKQKELKKKKEVQGSVQKGDYTNAEVAILFAIPVDLIEYLLPKSKRWSKTYVHNLQRNRPEWFTVEEAARRSGRPLKKEA